MVMAFPAHAAPVKIYVKANVAPKLYVWSNIDGTKFNGEWPGTTMAETTTIAGETWYVSPAAYENVKAIINDGSGQTGDIIISEDNHMFVYGGGATCCPASSRDEAMYAYAVDYNNWGTMYAYAWSGEGNDKQENAAWPGQAMTWTGAKDGKGVYLWMPNNLSFMPSKVIFTNNGGAQTTDLNFVNGSYYNISTSPESGKYPADIDATIPLVPIDAVHFPDEYFRDYLNLSTVNTADDQFLTANELRGITHLDIEEAVNHGDIPHKVTDITGIKYFKKLYVIKADNQELTSIDISKNIGLNEVQFSNNNITQATIGTQRILDRLKLNNNNLSSIDVSGCININRIEVNDNNLTEINVSSSPVSLQTLLCNNNAITSLDLSQNTGLLALECGHNQLTSLDVSHNSLLHELICDHNNISTLSLYNGENKPMKVLIAGNNQLTNLDFSGHSNLEVLAVHTNPLLSSLTLPETSLMLLSCSDCNLSSIDLSAQTDIEMLTLSGNPFTTIDLSKCTNLTFLNLYYTNIVNLDLSKNPILMYGMETYADSDPVDWEDAVDTYGAHGWKDENLELGVISPNGRAIASPQAIKFNGKNFYFYDLAGDNSLENILGDGFELSKVTEYDGATVVTAGGTITAEMPEYVQGFDTSALTGDVLVINPDATQFSCMVSTGFSSGLDGSDHHAPHHAAKLTPIKKESGGSFSITDPTELNELFGSAEIQLSYELPELPVEPAAITFSPASGSTVRYGRKVTIEAPDLGTWQTDYEIYYTLDGTDPENVENYYNGGSTYQYSKDGIIIGDEEGTNGTPIRARAYKRDGLGESVVGEATYTTLAQQSYQFTRITSEDDLEAGAHYLIVASIIDGGQKYYIASASFEETDSRDMVTCLHSAWDEAEPENGVISLSPYYLSEPYVLSGNATNGWKFTSTEGLRITPRERSAEALADNENEDLPGEMDLTLDDTGATGHISFDEDGYVTITFDGFNGRVAFMCNDDDGFVYRPASSDVWREGEIHVELWKAAMPELAFNKPSGTYRYGRQIIVYVPGMNIEDYEVYYTLDGADPTTESNSRDKLEGRGYFELDEDFLNAPVTIKAVAFQNHAPWEQLTSVTERTYQIVDQEPIEFEQITSTDQLEAGKRYLFVIKDPTSDMGAAATIEQYYYEAPSAVPNKNVIGADVENVNLGYVLNADEDGTYFTFSNGVLSLTKWYLAEPFTLSGDAEDGWIFTGTEGTQLKTLPVYTDAEQTTLSTRYRKLTLADEGTPANIAFDSDEYAAALITFEGFDNGILSIGSAGFGPGIYPDSQGPHMIQLWKEKSTTAETTPDIASGTAVHYGQPVVVSYDNRIEGDKFYYTTDGTEPTVDGATTRRGWGNNWFLVTVEGTYKFLFTDSEGTPKATGQASYTILDDQQHVYAKMVTSEDDLIAGEKYFIISGEYTEDVTIGDVHYDKLFVPNFGMTPFTEPRNNYFSVGRKGLFEYKESDTDHFDFALDLTKGDNDCQLEVMSLEHLDMIDVHDRFSNYINHYFIEPYTLGGTEGAWTMTNTLGTSIASDGLQFYPGDESRGHKYHLTLSDTPSPMTIAFGTNGEAILQIDGKTLVDDDKLAYSFTSRNMADYSEDYPPMRLYRVYKGIPVTLAEFIETTPDGETTYVIDEDLTVMLVREDVEWHETTDNGYEGEGWGLLVLRDDAQAVAPYYSTPGDNQEVYTIEGGYVEGGDQADYRQNNWLHYSLHDYTGENHTHKHIDMSAYKTGNVIKAGTLMGIHWAEGPLMAAFTTTDDYAWPEKKMDGEVAVEGDVTLNVYCPANFLLENLNWNNVAGACKYFFMTPKNFEVAKLTWAVYDEMEIGNETFRGFFVPQKSVAEGGDESTTHNGADLNGGVPLAWMNSMCQGTYVDESNNEVEIAKDTQPSTIFKKGTAYEMTVWIATDGVGNPDVDLTDEPQPIGRRAPNRVEPKTNKVSGNFAVFPVDVQAKGSVITGVKQITDKDGMKEVKAVRIYNVAGIELRQPQPGVNIIVTEYTDGTTSTTKVLK